MRRRLPRHVQLGQHIEDLSRSFQNVREVEGDGFEPCVGHGNHAHAEGYA